MVLIMNLQNLQRENSTLLMTKIMDNMAEEMKMIQPLNLKQKSLNQILQVVMQILELHLKIVLVLQDVKKYK